MHTEKKNNAPFKRIVSLTIPDFYESVDAETGLMNMTPNKVGEYQVQTLPRQVFQLELFFRGIVQEKSFM